MKLNITPKQISSGDMAGLKDKIGKLPKKMPPLAGKIVPPDIFTPGKKNLP